MSRTNVEIDDVLVERAMRIYRPPTKEAAVRLALERLVGDALSADQALAMQGSGYPLDDDELEGPDDADVGDLATGITP